MIPLTISAWNVRTLMDSASSDRPQRRTALVDRELDRYKVAIAALSETRLAEEGLLKEVGAWVGNFITVATGSDCEVSYPCTGEAIG